MHKFFQVDRSAGVVSSFTFSYSDSLSLKNVHLTLLDFKEDDAYIIWSQIPISMFQNSRDYTSMTLNNCLVGCFCNERY